MSETIDQTHRTLVVEDEAVSRALMQAVLSRRGHEVELTEDGEGALEAFGEASWDLVILDLKLPGIDGIECLRRMREMPGADDTVVVVVTGVDDRETLEEVLAAGADDYVVKPVVNHQLDVRLSIAERKIRLIRERRRAEEALLRDALHDSLTGLPNRNLFMERLDHSVRRNLRKGGSPFAVLVVDIDHFRKVDETCGSEAGDAALVEVGERLGECIREADTVARLEDDEFAVLLDSFTDPADPTRVAERVMKAFEAPFEVDGCEPFRLTASVGIDVELRGEKSSEGVLRDAYRALVRAKAEGPGEYLTHDPALHARAVARVKMEAEARRGWEDGHMTLHYMPIVHLATGSVGSFEALIRWTDPERGDISPARFIPVIEETGLIHQIGSWTLREGMRQLAEWQDGTPDGFPVSLGVNVSGRQFDAPDILEKVMEAVESSGIPGHRLHLEITETAVMGNADEAVRTLGRLKEAAVELHIDDFGTGYSSLAYLCRLPIDTLKIDRAFVAELPDNEENLEVVRTVVRLAHNLGLQVVAEGVENEAQLRAVTELGCEFGQGWHFSRALPADEALAFGLERGLVVSPPEV